MRREIRYLRDLIAPSTDPTIRLEWNEPSSTIDRSIGPKSYAHPGLRTLHDSCSTVATVIAAINVDHRREREREGERGGSRRCSGVYFVVGGWRARVAGGRSRVASHESTIVQIITSPWRRSSPERRVVLELGSSGSLLSLVHNVARGGGFVGIRGCPRSRFPHDCLGGLSSGGSREDRSGRSRRGGGGTGRSRCARVFIAPYCIPIKSSGAGSRRTVKATDACSLLLLPPLPCRPAIVLLSVERCPPTTHDLGPGLATGIESGALFFLHGCISREGEDYYLHLDFPLLASGPKSKGERILSRCIVLDVRAAILEGTAFLHERVIESAAIFPAREKEISKDSGGGERRGKEETR